MLDKAEDTMEDRVEELWSRFGLHNSVPGMPAVDSQIEPLQGISEAERYTDRGPASPPTEGRTPEFADKSTLEQADAWETQRLISEELAEAREIRTQLEEQRDQIYSEVTDRVQGIVESAIVRAQAEIADLKRHAIDEIKIVLKRIETLQEETFEELKIQRILNDVEQLKATSEWMTGSESGAFDKDKIVK